MSRALSIQWVDADPPTKSRGQDGTISRQLTGRKPQTARRTSFTEYYLDSPSNDKSELYHLYQRPAKAGTAHLERQARDTWKDATQRLELYQAMVNRALNTGELSADMIDRGIFRTIENLKQLRDTEALHLERSIRRKSGYLEDTRNVTYPGFYNDDTKAHCFRDRYEEKEFAPFHLATSDKLLPERFFRAGGQIDYERTALCRLMKKATTTEPIKRSSLQCSEKYRDPPLFDAATPRRHAQSHKWLSHNFKTSLSSNLDTFDKHKASSSLATTSSQRRHTSLKRKSKSKPSIRSEHEIQESPYMEPNPAQQRLEPCRDPTSTKTFPHFHTVFRSGKRVDKGTVYKDPKMEHTLATIRLRSRRRLNKLMSQ